MENPVRHDPGLGLSDAPARELLRRLPETGVLILDDDLRVGLCEGGAFTAAGWDTAAIEGRLLEDVLPADAWAQLEPHYRAAAAGEPRSFRMRAGNGRAYEVLASPLAGGGVFVVTVATTGETEALLRTVFDAAGTALVVFAADRARFGDVVQANAATARLFGYTPDELTSGNLRSVFPPEDADAAEAELRRLAAEGGEMQAREEPLVDAVGRRLWARLHVTFIRDDAGRAVLGVAQIEDVTKERLREEALRFSQERFGLVFHQAPVGMVMVDLRPGAAGTILDANEAYAELVGRRLSELPGTPLREITHVDDVVRDDELLDALHRGEVDAADIEKRFLRPDGSIRSARVRVGVVRDAAGVPLYALRVAVDTTDRRQAEAQREVLLESVFEAVVGLDGHARVTEFNRAAELLFGIEREAVLGRSAIDLFVPLDLHGRFASEIGTYGPVQVPLLRGDGTPFHAELCVRASAGADGELTACVRDMTSERRAEQRRRGAEDLFRSLFEESAVPMAVLDLEGLCLEPNPELCRFLGRSAEELRSCTIADVTHPDDHVPTDQLVAALEEHGPLRREKRFVRGDGEIVWGQVHSALLRDEQGRPRGLQSQIVDISARRDASARLGAVLESLTEGVLVVGGDGMVENANPAACRMLAAEEGQLCGCPVAPLLGDGAAAVATVPLTGVALPARDGTLIRADGSELPASFSVAPLDTGVVIVFSDISERRARERTLQRRLTALDTLERARTALRTGRMVLHSQPILDVASGRVVQEELLLRMRDEDGTLVAPCEFLPIAEEYGLISDIDRWVIGEAARIAATGRHVEVNISGKTLGHRDLTSWVEDAISATGADPRSLTFEITETALTNDLEQAARFAEHVSALGCGFALDDFGTGYGSFTLLKRLPISYLKIDMEFARSVAEDEADRHVVQAVVGLARGLGMKTIAEGVETQEAADVLAEIGVDYLQGWLIGRPAEV